MALPRLPRRLLVLLGLVLTGGLLTLRLGGTAHVVRAFDYSQLSPIQRRLLSGTADEALNPARAQPTTVNAATLKPVTAQARQATPALIGAYFPDESGRCTVDLDANIRVNQNCLNLSDPDLQGRAQANNEPAISQDPNAPNHLVAGNNDYRRGDGGPGGAYSLDNGEDWVDTTVPYGFTRGAAFGAARQYWQACGDTATAWDTRGNAYFQCQVFNRGVPATSSADTSSGIYIYRSTGNAGASWNFPGRPVIEAANATGANGGLPLEDKPYMTVDNHLNSPFRDRIYVAYTEFAANGTAYIFLSSSKDYGEHFSKRVVVSANSPLCTVTYGLPTPNGACNANQFADPFTGPDGALYVVYANFNNAVTGSDNRNQVLLVKSTDGGATFSAPVKVADYYDLPDCGTYQGGKDAGRACVPEKGSSTNSFFRAANYPVGAVNPLKTAQVAVTFGSYINVHSKESNGCVPNGFSGFGINLYTGVKTAGACNNDILLSVSSDGGQTFTGTSTDPRQLTSITSSGAQGTSDQWFQWAAFSKRGQLAVSYYDRQYGTDETTGWSDFSLSGSIAPTDDDRPASAADLTSFGVRRVTTGSLPPPTQFSGLFWGDYTGLTADDLAHPIWSDTRGAELFLCPGTGTPTTPPAVCTGPAANAPYANDQDIYTATLPIPLATSDEP